MYVVLAVVGNKSDCESSFDFSKAQLFGREIGAQVYRTSAKTGEGIDHLFSSIASQLLRQHEEKVRLRELDVSGAVDDLRDSFSRRDDILSLDGSHRSGRQRRCC